MCLAKWLKPYKSYAWLPIRFVLAAVFIFHGYGKLFAEPGIAGFTGMLSGLGIPAAGVMAIVIALIEFAGGILMLLGLFSRYVAVLQTAIMLVAIVTVHWANGFNFMDVGWAFNFVMIGGLLGIILNGPGIWNLETKLFNKEV